LRFKCTDQLNSEQSIGCLASLCQDTGAAIDSIRRHFPPASQHGADDAWVLFTLSEAGKSWRTRTGERKDGAATDAWVGIECKRVESFADGEFFGALKAHGGNESA
jgi:hypothetical protein